MLFAIRVGVFVLAISALCAGNAAAEQRIAFNIFNASCQTRLGANDIAVDDYGIIYLLDARGRVERFNYNGRHAGFLLSPNPSTPEIGAEAVTLDASGAIYVADNSRGLYQTGRYPDQHITRLAMLPQSATDLAVDAGGTIHASIAGDAGGPGNRLLRIGPAGNVIATFILPPGTRSEGMDTDSGRNVYLADEVNDRVIVQNPDGQFRFITHETELRLAHGLAVAATPFAEELLVGLEGISEPYVSRFAPDGRFIGRIPVDAFAADIDVDRYGSIYVLTENGSIHGIDPDIAPEQLVTAARAVVLPGHPLDGSSQGEYLKGLAVRAARTIGNFPAVIEARRRLEALRAEAQYNEALQEDPVTADRISRSLEEINGFLTAVETYSPLVVGEDCDPEMEPFPQPSPVTDLKGALGELIGDEPFYGRYRSDTPIGFPLPPRIELTLDTSTATSSFIKPGVWGGDNAITGLVRPEVISSGIAIDIGPGGAIVSEFSSEFGSIDINGMPSGINRSRLAPNGQVFSSFGPGAFSTIEFEAHAEGIITNDLYPNSRPIFTFADLEGYMVPGSDSAAAYGTNEPMIVPGAPGGPPTDLPGIAFIATRVSFDPALQQLRFRENTDPSDAPDVSVILTPDGVFAGGIGAGEPVAGATFVLDPLVFSDFNLKTGRFEFSDATFQIMAGQATLASGRLTDIGIDPEEYLFTASLALDDLPAGVDSPFLDALAAYLPQILLLTPDATSQLLRGSDSFTSVYQSPTHLMVIAALVPEPSAIVLLALASVFFSFIRIRLLTYSLLPRSR